MSTMTATFRESVLERRFKFAEQGTTLRRDSMAGLTTFIVMSYIIALNPLILTSVKDHTGYALPFSGVLTSTCMVAAVMSILMGLYTNRAYAIAPGMGLNAVVTFGLVSQAGATWPEAMGIVLLEGVAVVVLVLSGVREAIMKAIPLELKKAIAIGIGLFIAFIGLFNSGLIVQDPSHSTPVALARLTTWPVFVTVFGLVFTIAMRAIRFRGDLLVGLIGTTIIATLINWGTSYKAFGHATATWPHSFVTHPNFTLFGNISFHSFASVELGVVATLTWVFALFLSDFFDMMGTIVGVGKAAGYLDKNGELPQMRKPLLVDALSAVAGGAASSSSATTYIESGSGVAAGGRTGWVAIVAGALFIPFMFLSPIIGMVPPQATAAALVIVGYLMISNLTEAEEEAEPGRSKAGGVKLAGIDFHDLAIGLAAALTIIVMPFTYTITDGIGFGFIAYTLVCASARQWKRIHPFMWVATAGFVLYFLVPLLQDHVSWFS